MRGNAREGLRLGERRIQRKAQEIIQRVGFVKCEQHTLRNCLAFEAVHTRSTHLVILSQWRKVALKFRGPVSVTLARASIVSEGSQKKRTRVAL